MRAPMRRANEPTQSVPGRAGCVRSRAGAAKAPLIQLGSGSGAGDHVTCASWRGGPGEKGGQGIPASLRLSVGAGT